MPLSSEEVAQLARNEGKALRNDPRKLSHFLARLSATLRRHGDEMRQLKGELERGRAAANQGVGQATTLSPMDAVRYLSPVQLQQVFGTVARQQMEWLAHQQSETEGAKRRANKIVADLRYLVVQLREDPAQAQSALTIRLTQMLSDAEQLSGQPALNHVSGVFSSPPTLSSVPTPNAGQQRWVSE